MDLQGTGEQLGAFVHLRGHRELEPLKQQLRDRGRAGEQNRPVFARQLLSLSVEL